MMKRSSGSYGRVTGAFIGCLGLCVFCCTAPAQDVDPTAPRRGKTYASIQELPDWQGWWGPLSLPAYFSTIWGIIRNAPFEPTSRAELDAMIRGNDTAAFM